MILCLKLTASWHKQPLDMMSRAALAEAEPSSLCWIRDLQSSRKWRQMLVSPPEHVSPLQRVSSVGKCLGAPAVWFPILLSFPGNFLQLRHVCLYPRDSFWSHQNSLYRDCFGSVSKLHLMLHSLRVNIHRPHFTQFPPSRLNKMPHLA